MADNIDRIRELLARIDALNEKQENVSKEIEKLKSEIYDYAILETDEDIIPSVKTEEIKVEKPKTEKPVTPIDFGLIEEKKTTQKEPTNQTNKKTASNFKLPKSQSGIEKFIGENLISKLGILVILIGVGFGTKYAIDNDLIGPSTRIVLGYLLGLGLVGFALYLKEKYHNFSAVLLSGGLAIFYFITYAAYDFYELIPQLATFGLMFLFTIFGVFSALKYNKQVIAHIGLVGAYALPFLVGESDDMTTLFVYMLVVNLGVLYISIQKNWRALQLTAFMFTWAILVFWFWEGYEYPKDFRLALSAISVFFGLFYFTFLSYKIEHNKKISVVDFFLICMNAFIYFGMGYAILSETEWTKDYLGLFTLANAIAHFIACFIIYRKRLADKSLFYLLAGLVLIFITMAIPIQLDGNMVTMSWTLLAILLFCIGRTQKVVLYEFASLILMLLAFGSLIDDWQSVQFYQFLPQEDIVSVRSIFNIHFLSTAVFAAAFGIGIYIKEKYPFVNDFEKKYLNPRNLFDYILPGFFLVALYFLGSNEISWYFDQEQLRTSVETGDTNYYNKFDRNIAHFKSVWQCIYALLFFSIVTFINLFKIKSEKFSVLNLILNFIAIISFMVIGLWSISELRVNYLDPKDIEYFRPSAFHLIIRYIGLASLMALLYASYRYIKSGVLNTLKFIPEILFHLIILWFLSSELLHWLDIMDVQGANKLSLSILVGLYSLGLIALGIWKKKRYLRVTAIILFAFTLVKLFFYDIAHLSTISKTVVFIILGILLLIISFLYNKYTKNIFDESTD